MDAYRLDRLATAQFEKFKAGEYSVFCNQTQVLKAICLKLAAKHMPYSVTNMPGGVKCISNVVDTCPCCKRKLK